MRSTILSSRCDTETCLPFALVYALWYTDRTSQPNLFVLTSHNSHEWMAGLLSTSYFRRLGATNTFNTKVKQFVIFESLIAYSQGAYSWTSDSFCDCLNLWFRDGQDEACWSLPVWYSSCQSCLKVQHILYTLGMYSTHASFAVDNTIPTQLLKLNDLLNKCCRSWHSSKQTMSIFWPASCNYHWLFCFCLVL